MIVVLNFFSKKKNKFEFFGPFLNWKEALRHSKGYSDPQILNKILISALKVRDKKYLFERDGILFDKPEYNWKLIYYIMKYSTKNLNIIDFGGSLGSSYFQNKDIFKNFKKIKWNIVEQQKIVGYGKKFFTDKNLTFFENIEKAIKKSKSKIIIINNVLQYLEKPYDLIKLISKYKGFTLIIDKIIFSSSNKDIILVQKTPKRIYDSTYPIRLFSRQKFMMILKKKFKLLYNNKYKQYFVDFDNVKYKYEYLIIKT